MQWVGWKDDFEESVITTSLEQAINWARESSMWPMTFGLACCAIEMMATGASRYDIDRFGAGAFRATPRQADLMIVAGTVNFKMASRVRRLYNQMPDPKFVIAMGACTCGGGPYYKYGYNVVKGVDLVVPVDVYVPGCPPRPEALLEGLMRIQDKVQRHEGPHQGPAAATCRFRRAPAIRCCRRNSSDPDPRQGDRRNRTPVGTPQQGTGRPGQGTNLPTEDPHRLMTAAGNHRPPRTEVRRPDQGQEPRGHRSVRRRRSGGPA